MPRRVSRTRVVLQFSNAEQLWEFYRSVKLVSVDITMRSSVLVSECSAVEIKLAKEKFGAVVIQGQE